MARAPGPCHCCIFDNIASFNRSCLDDGIGPCSDRDRRRNEGGGMS